MGSISSESGLFTTEPRKYLMYFAFIYPFLLLLVDVSCSQSRLREIYPLIIAFYLAQQFTVNSNFDNRVKLEEQYFLDGKKDNEMKKDLFKKYRITCTFPERYTCTASKCIVQLLKIQYKFKVALISFNAFEYIFLRSQISGYEKLNLILIGSSSLTESILSRFCKLSASVDDMVFPLLCSRQD